MERITPQYKRGKYINRKNRKKRITILCLCVAIVLTAAALALVLFWGDLFPAKEEAAPSEANGAAQSSAAPTDANGVAQTDAATEPPEQISGTQTAIADGRLLLTYDPDALALTNSAGVTTLLDRASGAETPRMDIQMLPGKLGMLRDSEKERIAIALMQAYYYHPQHTADAVLSVVRNDKNEFSATMQVPAIDGAPTAVCSVRLLAAGDELWAAVLLQPEGAENPALANAFLWLATTEENS